MLDLAAIKFLHCADIHMDMPFTSLDSESGKSSVRRQEIKETFKNIVETADRENVNLLLICGDLYEHGYVKKSTISFINDELGRIPHIEVFMVPGNHDPLVKSSYYCAYKWNRNVHILTEDNPYVILEDLKTCVFGLGFKGFSEEKPLVYDLKPLEPSYINILLTHGTVDINVGQNIYNPMTSENLASLGMDYIALGHFHNRLDDIGGRGLVYNPGSPEPLGFDEEGEHGVFIGSVTKEKSEVKNLEIRFIKTGKRFYENLEVDAGGSGTDEQVADRIEAALKGKRKEDGLFRVTLKGYLERDFSINTAYILSRFKDSVFFMKLKDETAMDYDYERIISEPGLRGLFARKIFTMLDKTEDPYEKEQLLRALHYGIEALERGKVEVS